MFGEDRSGLGEGVLDRSARMGDPNHRISDDCLRLHYHQAVIKHMRGVAEPHLDTYYDDLDDMGIIMEREDAAEVLEIEFGNRLGASIEVSYTSSRPLLLFSFLLSFIFLFPLVSSSNMNFSTDDIRNQDTDSRDP